MEATRVSLRLGQLQGLVLALQIRVLPGSDRHPPAQPHRYWNQLLPRIPHLIIPASAS